MNERTKPAMLKVIHLWLKFLDWKLDNMLQYKKEAVSTTKDSKPWDESKHPRKSNGQFWHGDGDDQAFMKQMGAMAGALDPSSERADRHAARYYGLVRSMTTDVSKIAQNTGIPEEDVRYVKNYIFNDKHDLGGDAPERFAPSFYMAESWQRLIEGTNIQPHDVLMLKHEIMERELVLSGMTQEEAHNKTSEKYNYAKEAKLYHGKIGKHPKK